MNDQPRLLCFAGSARQDSLNKRLARLAASRARQYDADVSFLDLADYPMPLYHGDLEAREGLPEAARTLKGLFCDCDGFLIAAPEYNSSLTPLLKNTLDWISRREHPDEPRLSAYRGKVAALCAASGGATGGQRGLVALRMMLGNIGVHVLPQQLSVPHAAEAFDAQGELIDDQRSQILDTLIAEWIRVSRALRG
ncbi:oxidoreductase [Litchfieldella qijiaojingensis]|uniref:Oxidoreductase n=1 Tax=Litchfieldella qijiaojingensis TaxID=980347 RepID=A0ABQ2Z378_9GAMM|nr:NAD(P)H-dependent oxidoreductase [Halomonas qijiaojingensis]GGY02004.1 oxidoreductase [Halomonas qijiaojingensis]